MKQKKCDWSFKSVERDVRIQFNPQRRIDQLCSKTNSPIPGKYSPRWGCVDAEPTAVHYIPEPPNYGFAAKRRNDLQSMKICPHVIRTMEDWACQKVQSPFTPTPGCRGAREAASPNAGDSPLGKQTEEKEHKTERGRLRTPKTGEVHPFGAAPSGPGPRAVTQH